MHQSIIFEYNTTWHRAINMSPMLAFRNRAEKNRSMIAINDPESEVEESIFSEINDKINDHNSSTIFSASTVDKKYRGSIPNV